MARQPKIKGRVVVAKEPRIAPKLSDGSIAWRLSIIDFDGPWCWTKLTSDLKKEVYGKLAQYEQRKWSELGNRNDKPISVANLPAPAKKRLREIQQDDSDGALWELHLAGKQRVWGIRHGDIMYLLWWDPTHQVYPSPKRHT